MILMKTSGLLVLPVRVGMLKKPKMSFCGMATPFPVPPVRGSRAERVIEKGCAAWRMSVSPGRVVTIRATRGTSVEYASAATCRAERGARPEAVMAVRRRIEPRSGDGPDAARRGIAQARMPAKAGTSRRVVFMVLTFLLGRIEAALTL